MYSDDQIQIVMDHFLRTWLKARNVLSYRLERAGPLFHVAYTSAPMLTTPSRLNEFLVLQGNPQDNLDLIHSRIDALPHWLTVFTHDPAQTKRDYTPLGYEFVSDEFLMRLPNLEEHLRPVNPNLAVRRVQTVDEGMWLNQTSSQMLVHPPRLRDPDMGYYYIANENLPVCTGRYSIIDKQIVGPDKIQTHPAFRRQGLGSELLNTMHRDAVAVGCTESVLLSSVEGQRLYQRLGYDDVSPAVVFASVHRTSVNGC